MNLSVLDKNVIVDNLVKSLRRSTEVQFIELELAVSQLVILEGIIVHDLALQDHVLQRLRVKSYSRVVEKIINKC